MITTILQLIAGLVPTVGNIILLFKNSDGSTTALISSAQTATAADIAQMQAYLAQHQAASPAPAAPATPPAA
jgi:hypothetical protein